MTPAVPDPTVEALATMSRGEGVEFYAKVLDAAGFPLAAVIVRDAAARAAAPDALRVRGEALAAEFGECWVTRSEVRCTGFIGGTFKNGGEWVEAMCCLPCRVRALLEETQ